MIFTVVSLYYYFNFKILITIIYSFILIIGFTIISQYSNKFIYKKLNYPEITNVAELNFVEYYLTNSILIKEKLDIETARNEAKKDFIFIKMMK